MASKVEEGEGGATTKPRVVFVIGSTGVGKTKLGVEVAKRFNGEVINADAMQMYRGLAIATAKVTKEEAQGVPHHFLDNLSPTEQFTVKQFQEQALGKIQELHAAGKLPVVVGGTTYYVQALLRPQASVLREEELAAALRRRIAKAIGGGGGSGAAGETAEAGSGAAIETAEAGNGAAGENAEAGSGAAGETAEAGNGAGVGIEDGTVTAEVLFGEGEPLRTVVLVPPPRAWPDDFATTCETPSAELHAALEKVDPVMASRLHPHDRRKILRSLIVHDRTGARHSDLLLEQAQVVAATAATNDLFDCRVLWLNAEAEVLHDRLNRRVDGMLEAGLLEEVAALRRQLEALPTPVHSEFTTGVLQAIGFKEFAAYLDAKASQTDGVDLASQLAACVEQLKLVTRRYARQQRQFVRNRLIKRGVVVHHLDSTRVSEWKDKVQRPAFRVIAELLDGVPEKAPPGANDAAAVFAWKKRTCEPCGKTLNGDHEWQVHVAGRRHKKAVAAARRRERDAAAGRNVKRRTHD